jgi:hypothetical protein
MPFDYKTASATRIEVWKAWRQNGLALLNRKPAQPFKYDDIRLKLESCGGAPIEALVEGVYEKKEGLQ